MTLDPRLDRAIRDHMTMAQSIAWRYVKKLPKVEPDEILSIAYEALAQVGAKWIPYCEARGFSPWSEDDPERPEAHFGGYVAKTVNGRILDWCRRQDHVTRTDRRKLKQIQAAEENGALDEAELAGVTGLSVRQICEAQAAGAVTLSSLDDHADYEAYGGIADSAPGVEAQAGMHDLLTGFMAVFGGLDAETRVILAMRYFFEKDFTDIAGMLRTGQQRVTELNDAAVLAVHDALVRSVVSMAA